MTKQEFIDLLKNQPLLELIAKYKIYDDTTLLLNIQKLAFKPTNYNLSIGNVDVRKIIGTDHPDYHGNSWEFTINNLKRNVNLNRLMNFPEYYYLTSAERNNNSLIRKLSYITFDNGKSYYIYGDGNHRTIIAKHIFALENMLTGNANHILYGVEIMLAND